MLLPHVTLLLWIVSSIRSSSLIPPASVSSRLQPPVIGVLGGIGSGKSAIAQSLSKTFRTLVLDADKVGHEVLNLPVIQERIRNRFGDEVFSATGIVDRRALAAKVFGTEEVQQQARRDLNALVHPAIRAQLLQQIQHADSELDLLILDAAVMLEAGWGDLCDAIVFVDAPFEARLARVQQRGWSEDELRRREASQMSLDDKRRRADLVIDNSGHIEDGVRELVKFVEGLQLKRLPRTES